MRGATLAWGQQALEALPPVALAQRAAAALRDQERAQLGVWALAVWVR
jgi:hypothetical protein